MAVSRWIVVINDKETGAIGFDQAYRYAYAARKENEIIDIDGDDKRIRVGPCTHVGHIYTSHVPVFKRKGPILKTCRKCGTHFGGLIGGDLQ